MSAADIRHTRPILLPEWAPQDAVLVAWPHADTDWGDDLSAVEDTYAALSAAVTRFEDLVVLCRDTDQETHIVVQLRAGGADIDRCHLARAGYDDTWARDYGPLTVAGPGALELRDFIFNGWGGKFEAVRDDAANRTLAERGVFAVPLVSEGFVLEGGSVDTDGAGTILTTERCLLAPTRNPGLDREGIETRLADDLGATRVLWLGHGELAGDDTDAHVDTLARFCDPHTIAYQACDDPTDPHYDDLRRMAAELAAMHDASGRPYTLRALPWPRAQHHPEDGHRLPATYANFLIINGAVLVPTYDDPADTAALDVLAACFPDREVIGIDARPLIRQHGSLHCITMQLPAGTLAAAGNPGVQSR